MRHTPITPAPAADPRRDLSAAELADLANA